MRCWDLPAGGILGQYLGSVFFIIGATRWASSYRRSRATSPSRSPTGRASRRASSPGSVAAFMDAPASSAASWAACSPAGWPLSSVACPLPRWLRGLMPVVIIPLVGSIVASGLLILFLGGPIAGPLDGAERLADRPLGAASIVLG